MSGECSLSESDLEVLDALAKHDLRIVIIGGHAVRHYGVQREPGDLDLLVDSTPGGGANLVAALRDLRADVTRHAIDSFGQPSKQIPVKYGDRNVELLTSLPHLPFDEVYDNAQITLSGRRQLRIISIHHLIIAKRAAGRPVDMSDVSELDPKQA